MEKLNVKNQIDRWKEWAVGVLMMRHVDCETQYSLLRAVQNSRLVNEDIIYWSCERTTMSMNR